ncbi:hypothetical protein BELL_0218g00060 [Botrytis elliptica]|uniref:Gti1/Pac2 family protein n=2 Tax=Botrytis TaxID=33196 RepID=A0A4Z1JPV5_9HELO|nr:hypothetical protein BELL_0218g00060 [Botrytis elliptica]
MMASLGASMPMPVPVAVNGTLKPTWYGYIPDTKAAMILLEAAFTGKINHIARRPHDKERSELIKSGNIFIHEAQSSGVKRWTDGTTWSPSRMVGNFLVYRELNKPFAPGEKKRAMAKDKRQGIRKNGNGSTSPGGSVYSSMHGPLNKEMERELVGSLVDSYDFKKDGNCLIKKTITVQVGELTHHIVSYYTIDDVVSGKLSIPQNAFPDVKPRRDIIYSKSYKHSPNDSNLLNEDDVHENHLAYQHNSGRSNYDYSNRNAPRLPAPSAHGMAYQTNSLLSNNNYTMGMSAAPYSLAPFNGNFPAVSSGPSSYNNILSGSPNSISPYTGGLPATSSHASSYAQYSSTPSTYDTQRADAYNNVYRQQRHGSISNMNATPLAHRSSSYGQQGLSSGVSEMVSGMPAMIQGQMSSRSSHDSAASGMFQSQMGSRNFNESTYASPNLYQTRDATTPSHGYSQAQRTMSQSNQPYNTQTGNQYPQNMETSPGNVSTGHAHYNVDHQTWPSSNGL